MLPGMLSDARELSRKLTEEKIESTLAHKQLSLEQKCNRIGKHAKFDDKLNNMSLMCPFLDSFQHSLNINQAKCIANNAKLLDQSRTVTSFFRTFETAW